MSIDSIKKSVYELERAANNMSNDLSSCSDWNDKVQQSYYRYTEDALQGIRNLNYECDAVINKANSALSINPDKFRSELSSYRSRLRGI